MADETEDDLQGLFRPVDHIDYDHLEESEISLPGPFGGRAKVISGNNFAMMIPLDVMRWPSGEPMRFIEHKYPWLQSLSPEQLAQLGKLTGPQREDEYFKWIEHNPQPKREWIYKTDKPKEQ